MSSLSIMLFTMQFCKLLLIASIAFIVVELATTSSYGQAQLIGYSNSLSAASGSIVSDQFTIAGTRGTDLCDRLNIFQIDADQRGINAGQIHVSFTANMSVDFWLLNQFQYNAWMYNYTDCGSRLEAPSVLTVASRSTYENSTVRIPKTDNYFFVFDNRNPGSVSVRFEANYPVQGTSTTPVSKGALLDAEFNLIGISGTHAGCIYNDDYHALASAGQLSVSFSSKGGPVDFWILNQREHEEWIAATSKSCSILKEVSSVYTAISSYGYSGIVRINSTDTYYFAFANFNQGNVSITLSVSTLNQRTDNSPNDIQSILANPQLLAAQIGNYWQQVLGAAATGSSIVLGWMFRTRKRRFLTGYMAKIDSTYNEYAVNREECVTRLEKMRTEIVHMLKKGKIDESHFTILDGKIAQYLKELG